MALDHALLRRAAISGDAVLRVYSWRAPTLSFGRHQPARGLYDPEAIRDAGMDIVRRPTGGRAVLHHREVTYSVTAPIPPTTSSERGIPAGNVYEAINALLVDALCALGIAASLAPPGTLRRLDGDEATHTVTPRPSAHPCFDVATEGEVVVGGRKLVGSAQWRDPGAVLQHGSILIADDQTRLASLSRSRIVPAPVATVADLLGREPTIAEVARVLRKALDDALRRAGAEGARDYADDGTTAAVASRVARPIRRRRLDLASLTSGKRLPARVVRRHVGAADCSRVRRPPPIAIAPRRRESPMSRPHPVAAPIWLAGIGLAVSMVACRADRANPGGGAASGNNTGGTLVIALPADVETFLPPYATAVQSKLAVDMMFDRLADLGDSVNTIGDHGFVPRLAARWQWSPDSLAITFQLDPRARWHDGAHVEARDVLFTYALYTDSSAGIELATQLTAIDSVTASDSMTVTFWFKHRYPEQFFDATYQMIICPEHLLRGVSHADLRSSDFAHHPVGNARFRFVSWSPGSTVDLVADTANYLGRPRLDRVILSLAPNYAAALTKLLAGDADFFEVIRPDNLAEVQQAPSLRLVPYDDPAYGFVWFNLAAGNPAKPHPIFGDVTVRRALALALDRERMVRNVFDTLAVVAQGPFARSSPAADPTLAALPYDTVRANRLLDSAGWRRGPDGVRSKNGRPLAFTLTAPTSSKIRQQFAVLIQDQWAAIGARVAVDPLEIRVFIDGSGAMTSTSLFRCGTRTPA